MPPIDDTRTLPTLYLDALSRKDFDAFERLLAADVTFHGPQATLSGRAAVANAYRRLGPMLERTELKKVFIDGEELGLIYDFVTNTAAGAVPTLEWLTLDGGLVRSIWLLTDHVRWPRALAELMARA
jgi:hypothetical protein